MAQKEKIFPLSTTGGRIQHLRIAKELSRPRFYDLMYEGVSLDDASKRRTIRNWESGKTTSFPLEDLKHMCEIFNCDAEYLLCIQDEPRKKYAHISEMTGLSYGAAEYLASLNENYLQNLPVLAVISELITQMKTKEELGSDRDFLHCLAYYMQTDYFPEMRDKACDNITDRDYDADWGALVRELTLFTNAFRQKKFHTD